MSATTRCRAELTCLPDELFGFIDAFLSCEDSQSFKMAHVRICNSLRNNFHHYNKMHLSDDPSECRVSDKAGRVPPRKFCAANVGHLLREMTQLEEITVIMKDVCLHRDHRVPLHSIAECTPYSYGGYLLQLLGAAPPTQRALRQISLHVDVMIESLSEGFIPCPVEDLRFAIERLADAPFNTYVQISICCAQFKATDEMARNFLISGMQHALKASADVGAKTEFVVEPCEGYVDMTVEKGRMEYSFAFFYYNPTICDPSNENDEPIAIATK